MRWTSAVGTAAAGLLLSAQALPNPAARLRAAKADVIAARQRAETLEMRSRQATDAAERARTAQAAVGARLQAVEANATAAELRLALLRQEQRRQEQRLAAAQQPLARLMASLQIAARRPPAAALVQPGTISDAVHLRAILSAIRPTIDHRTVGLRAEANRARQFRAAAALTLKDIKEQKRLAAIEQRRLVALEVEQRRQSLALAAGAKAEAEHAATIAAQTVTLEQLVGSMSREADRRERLADLPGPLQRPDRLSAAMPLDAAPISHSQLSYRLPVLGQIARGFGEVLPSGSRSRGVTIEARSGALVVAPAAGRVSFAGLYRRYGVIAIVDHGGGHVSLITGLSGHIARIGDRVVQGSPIGRAGGAGVTVELRRDGEPVDVSQFVA